MGIQIANIFCGRPDLEHMQGLFYIREVNLRIRDGLRALHVMSFITLLFNPNRSRLVLKMLVLVEKVSLKTV